MVRRRPGIVIPATCVALCVTQALAAQLAERRVALVIGTRRRRSPTSRRTATVCPRRRSGNMRRGEGTEVAAMRTPAPMLLTTTIGTRAMRAARRIRSARGRRTSSVRTTSRETSVSGAGTGTVPTPPGFNRIPRDRHPPRAGWFGVGRRFRVQMCAPPPGASSSRASRPTTSASAWCATRRRQFMTCRAGSRQSGTPPRPCRSRR
jgi:hypothetical protein